MEVAKPWFIILPGSKEIGFLGLDCFLHSRQSHRLWSWSSIIIWILMGQLIAKIWFHGGANKVLVKQCHSSDHSTRAVSHRASMGKKMTFLSKASREHSVCIKQICMSMREGHSFPTSKVDKVSLCCFSSSSSWQKQNWKYLKQAEGWFCTNNSQISDPIFWMQ